MSVLVDTSALLAILREERGHETALAWAAGGAISAVHLSETLAKAGDRNIAESDVLALVAGLTLTLLPFDGEDALAAARLRPLTAGKDISLADRACLGTALRRRSPVLTGDHDWAGLGLNVELRYFRDKR